MRTALPAVLAVLTLYAGVGGHAQDAGVQDLVSRAARYVEEYERQLSAVVSEERQTQRVIKRDGTTGKKRELVSDLLMVKTGDYTQTFRDVIAVDGKPVRNRQERLQKLFLGEPHGRMKQAQAIAKESARYNIGFERGLDTLMLPLIILHAKRATGFRFARTADGLTFDEFRSPALLRSRIRGDVRDMFLRGALTIEDDTGRLGGARLVAENPQFTVTVDVRYVEEAASGLLVPVELREDYRTPVEKDRLEVLATYSNFRRFQVTVEERVEVPSPDR
ncbi:MAG TPA: hypothetical protein VFO67_09980 [Gemmatimonadales bacterium]|nr:hypothetical protein [Gemmatimonadales bacterium]